MGPNGHRLHGWGFVRFVSYGDNLSKRYGRYKKRYQEALATKQDSGGGLTELEIEQGMTIEDKLERLCPHFKRMHALLGERANMNLGMVDQDSVYDPDAANDDDEEGDEDNDDSPDTQGLTTSDFS